jgi:hypothetical protein
MRCTAHINHSIEKEIISFCGIMVTCNLPQKSGSVWIKSDLGGMH